jgi:hypothetical protein
MILFTGYWEVMKIKYQSIHVRRTYEVPSIGFKDWLWNVVKHSLGFRYILFNSSHSIDKLCKCVTRNCVSRVSAKPVFWRVIQNNFVVFIYVCQTVSWAQGCLCQTVQFLRLEQPLRLYLFVKSSYVRYVSNKSNVNMHSSTLSCASLVSMTIFFYFWQKKNTHDSIYVDLH